MVLLGCALDMMLLWVFAIISLRLIALIFGSESPGAHEILFYPPNLQKQQKCVCWLHLAFELQYLSCFWSECLQILREASLGGPL